MPIPMLLENGFQRVADAVYANCPAHLPAAEKLRSCKLVAHRGEHDNITILENTLAAFEKAEAAGVWGIECDVRWTADNTPVVSHDSDLQRLFGRPVDIGRISFRELQAQCPAIPSLETVIDRFGHRLHLMIEIKKTSDGIVQRSYDRLQELLSRLQPARDFHLMTLHPQVLDPITRIPPEALTAIAYDLPRRMSNWVRRKGWGGICGHYLLMTASRIKKHRRSGQKVGTGYAGSRNVLFREINRGVDWIFSNNAAAMQRTLTIALQSVSP